MARYTFGVFGQSSGELVANQSVTIKETGTNTVVASTSGGEVVDNNDGTYYVDDLSTGFYDIEIPTNTLHDETKDQLIVSDDLPTHLGDATKHRLIQDDGTGSGAGNGNTTTLWSGNQIHDWTHANFQAQTADLLLQTELDNSTLEFASSVARLKDSGVTNAKLATDAVTSAKIQDGSITLAKMADDSVDTAELVDDSVNRDKIANGEVLGSHIGNDMVGANHISHHSTDGALVFSSNGTPSFSQIHTDAIADGAITTAKLADTAGVTPANSSIDPQHFGVSTYTNAYTPAYNVGMLGSVPMNMGTTDFAWLTLSVDTDDFVLDDSSVAGTTALVELKVKQNFSSQNYISNSKTLNQNLDILDQRLGYLTQFSGTEGLWQVLMSSSWSHHIASDGNNSPVLAGNETPQLYTLTGNSETSQSFYTVASQMFYKVPDIRQITAYVKSYVSNTTNMLGKFRIRITGSSTPTPIVSSEITDLSASPNFSAVHHAIEDLQNYKFYTAHLDAMMDNNGVSNSNTYNISEWVVVAKRQLTIVSGSTSAPDGNPA